MKKYNFNQWLKEWLKVYKMPYMKHADKLERVIRLHIPQTLKDKQLVELNAIDLQKAINSVKTSRTALDVFDIIKASLTIAYKLGLIEKDITYFLVKPKHIRSIGKALTNDELELFITTIKNHRLNNYFLFCLYSGCRRAEALNVAWEDIDIKKGLLHVKGTKTALSDRYIPLFDKLLQVIKQIPKNRKKLFYHRADFVSRKFHEFCPKHKLHDLRHTFATRCLESGVNIKVVQTWLGHSRINTTADIYSHCLLPFAMEESKKVNF